MIIYNVTIKIDWSIQKDWVAWMQEVHIPGIISGGFFSDPRFVRLLEVNDIDGPTYAVQYCAHSLENYRLFLDEQAETFNNQELAKWGSKFIAFSTIMEVVQ